MGSVGTERFGRFAVFAAAATFGVWFVLRMDQVRTWLVTNGKRSVSPRTAHEIGEKIGINWEHTKFPVAEFARGLVVEMEHGLVNGRTNITNDDVFLTGKIAWAHLNEYPDYYTRLDAMERDAESYWRT